MIAISELGTTLPECAVEVAPVRSHFLIVLAVDADAAMERDGAALTFEELEWDAEHVPSA